MSDRRKAARIIVACEKLHSALYDMGMIVDEFAVYTDDSIVLDHAADFGKSPEAIEPLHGPKYHRFSVGLMNIFGAGQKVGSSRSMIDRR